MILLAAIDILEGQAVRLARGEFDQRTVYDADPLEAARRWVAEGARALHVVDLDGARAGEPVNLQRISSICRQVQVPVQVGGGLRSIEALAAVLEAGAWRAVLGTAAYRDLDLLDEALARFGDRVVVSIDARGGRLAAAAWSQQTDIDVTSAIEHLGARGVRRFVYSSIEHDGMLDGPDLEGARAVAAAVRGSFIYSGGVGSLEHLRALAALRQVNLAGVIVGRALYERRFELAQAQRVLDGEP